MQSSNIRDNNNRTSVDHANKKKQQKKQQKQPLKKKPSLPKSIHVQPKTPRVWCKCDCFFFKPQNIFKVFKICYWTLLSISLIPFVIGIIGLGIDGSEWYGRIPKVQRVVFPLYLALSIIQGIICSWQISKIYSLQINQKIAVVVLLLFCLSYIILAVVGRIQFMDIYDNRYDSSTCTTYLDQIFNPSIQNDLNVAKSNFCMKSQNCLCIIDNPSQFSQTLLSTLYYKTAASGVTNALACPNVNHYLLTSTGPKILENLELKYSCSGLCASEPLFYFSNINKGVPKTDSCFSIVVGELETITKIISLPILIIAGVMIVLLILIAITARQYTKDPECLVWRMASFQRQMTARQSHIQHQQSLAHSNSIQLVGGNGGNLNNSAMIGNNSVIFINGGVAAEGDQLELHNNSQMQNGGGSPSKKLTQSILVNNNMNESRQSPIHMNGSQLQKKVTILTPNSRQGNQENENGNIYQKDDPTVDIESSKHTPKGKIQFIKIESQNINQNEEI